MNQPETKSNARPAIVEMMGHRRFGAMVEETSFMGSTALRVVSLTNPPFEQVLTNPAAIFAITYCSEEQAKQASKRSEWSGAYVPEEFRRLLPPPSAPVVRPPSPTEDETEAELVDDAEEEDDDVDLDAAAEELLPNRRSEGDTGEYEESPSGPCDVCGATADEACKPDCFASEICDHAIRNDEYCADCADEEMHACTWGRVEPGVMVCRGCGNVDDTDHPMTEAWKEALSAKVMEETIARADEKRRDRIAALKTKQAEPFRCEHGKKITGGERCVDCEPKCEHGKPLLGSPWCDHGCNMPF